MEGVHPSRYALESPLVWTELDGEWVVFQPRTGVLLRPEPWTAAALVLLEDGPKSPSELFEHLGNESAQAADPTASLRQHVTDGLGELLDMGLILECR